MPAESEPPLVGTDRVLAVLTELAGHADGVSLEEMARAVASPKPTVHRALAALGRFGFASRNGHGRYVLGDEFLRLAFAHHELRPDHLRIAPVLTELAGRYGETAHYAVLDGASVVYRAKVDPPTGALRLTSTVGGRNPAHSTAVGNTASANGNPRQVIASRPSTAQRVGVNSDASCSHFGNTNDGTQAPPSITSSSITMVAMPRVAAALRPSVASASPNAALSRQNAAATARKPVALPPMRTPKISAAAR